MPAVPHLGDSCLSTEQMTDSTHSWHLALIPGQHYVQTPITFKSRNGFQSCAIAVALYVDLPIDWGGPYPDIGVSTWDAVEEAWALDYPQVLATLSETAPPGRRSGGSLVRRVSLVSSPVLF